MSSSVQKKSILAIITSSQNRVAGGGAPVFIVQNNEEIQRIAFLLENIMDAMAHELDQETYVVVRH